MSTTTFRVAVPNEPPQLGYSETGSPYTSIDSALGEAKRLAEAGGPTTTVYVYGYGPNDDPDKADDAPAEVMTNDVWSVSYRPEPPRLLSISALGVPDLEWPIEWRIVHDPTFDELTGEDTTGAGAVGNVSATLYTQPEKVTVGQITVSEVAPATEGTTTTTPTPSTDEVAPTEEIAR